MSKRPPKKKFTIIDVVRVATKQQEFIDGETIISDGSATDHRKILSVFQKQYIGQRSEAGSHQKRNEAVWQATLKILKENPKATAREAWNMLEGADYLNWTLEILDGVLVTRYEGLDPVQKRRKNPVTLTFKTYRTEYVSGVRKELGIAAE